MQRPAAHGRGEDAGASPPAAPPHTTQAPHGADPADRVQLGPEAIEPENDGRENAAVNALARGLREVDEEAEPDGLESAAQKADDEDEGKAAGAEKGNADGPILLENPSAIVIQDCADVMAALGGQAAQDLNLARDAAATPVAGTPGVLDGGATGFTTAGGGGGGGDPLQRLLADVQQARAKYGGRMPEEVEQLVARTMAAVKH